MESLGGGTGLTKIFVLFFFFKCYLEVVSIEATSLFLFACAASFGNMDNAIAKQ